MEIFDCEQGTDEWFSARCGVITSSKFKDVMTKGRGNTPSATRLTYMKELACELITGVVQQSFSNEWMARGNELEGQARAMLELERGFDVAQVGFIKTKDNIGTSTDGLIEQHSVLEIKCPKHTTHLDYLLDSEKLYKTYQAQVQGELLVTEREKALLVSFHPDFPVGKDLIIMEIERDEEYINAMYAELMTFKHELDTMVNNLKGE